MSDDWHGIQHPLRLSTSPPCRKGLTRAGTSGRDRTARVLVGLDVLQAATWPPPAGVGNIGAALAYLLVRGGEAVVLASDTESNTRELAEDLGPLARAASVDDAIDEADVIVFAVWLDTIEELVAQHASAPDGTVVIDPSNPIGVDDSGQTIRTVLDGQSAASVVAALLPASAHYAKAVGPLA